MLNVPSSLIKYRAFLLLCAGKGQLEIIARSLRPPLCSVVSIVEQVLDDLELHSQRLPFEVVRFGDSRRSPKNPTNDKATNCPDNQSASCRTTRPQIECRTIRRLRPLHPEKNQLPRLSKSALLCAVPILQLNQRERKML